MRRASSRLLPPFAPLAGSLLLMLAPAIAGHADASAVAAPTATINVTNCNDSGPGSLRAAVASAASGDTIDLTSLACSRIVLTNRGIQVPQNDLNVVGRHRDALTIDGNHNSRVFVHSGNGTLRLRRVSIANGYLTGTTAFGACILSAGNVELFGSRIHHCELYGRGGLEPSGGGAGITARRVLLSWSSAYANVAESELHGGGGAVAANEIVLDHSQVYGNRAVDGGGVYGGKVTATHSLIHGNQASGFGGGVFAGCEMLVPECTLSLRRSTVSGNRAFLGGGIAADRAYAAEIVESTVSDNIAWVSSAARFRFQSEARIFNSTIAFNREEQPEPYVDCMGAIDAGLLHLESSIVSRNACNVGADIDIHGDPEWDSITGSNNIIGNSDLPVPPDTISARPRLGPLTDNGGPTPTRKPQADSPALDRGSNPLNHRYDQRGSGFPRVKGGFPDIGAVER